MEGRKERGTDEERMDGKIDGQINGWKDRECVKGKKDG